MLEALWQEHRSSSFPAAPREVAGVELRGLNEEVTQSIERYLTDRKLGREACVNLRQTVAELQRVIPELSGEPLEYFCRLEGMAGILLHHCQEFLAESAPALPAHGAA